AKDSITIQNKVEYKDLIVGKEYVVKGKLMNKVMNKPLLIDGKEVTAET
ncbi:VaFE repeat-containing surface-anchored protein, partial [Bacillus wiedmannii]